jgi:hypothetical protein
MGGTKVHIIDDNGSKLKLEDEGQIPVVVHPHPPRDEAFSGAPLPFRQHFTDDGLPIDGASNESMIVDGSSTAVPFYIPASQDYDIYIKTISVSIGDSGTPTLNKFGTLAALTNGVAWNYFTQNEGEYILHEGIKTNLEFIRLGIDTGAIGTGTDAYLADVSGGGSTKSYLPTIDLAETFGLPWGVRLRKGTTDRIIFKVQDAMAGLDEFNAIGYGIRF